MASLDELEMVLLMRLSEADKPQLFEKTSKLLPIKVPTDHLNLMLRHLNQCEFVDLTSTHGEVFVEVTFLGRTVAKTCMAQLSKMERGVIARSDAHKSSQTRAVYPPVQINNTFAPMVTNHSPSNDSDRWSKSQASASWWGVIATIIGIVVAALVTLYVAGKL